MKKILISWYAFNNDFVLEQKGALKRKLGTINESGPTFNIHKYFWKEGNYSKHILLNSNLGVEDVINFNMLKSELSEHFKGHKIESRDVNISDPINVSEIFVKLNSLLAEYTEENIEIFISPGTPAMQTAWYLLGTNYKKNVTLFQLRNKEFTADKIQPEKIYVSLESNLLPTNLTVAQKLESKIKTEKDILITKSLETIYKKAELIALTDSVGCLILGENGTGKENLASYIHKKSNRSSKPFITVNCAAFSDDLLRSELFGHEKGAFTGADFKKIGVFEMANGGTIFLDEIGDISPKMQVALLRVLQEKKIQSVGSTKEKEIDVRVITATNKDLENLCDKEIFRWDLFFRLAITTLKLPALRERGIEETKDLINHFNKIYAKKFPNRSTELTITKEALNAILNYSFKGNIRELENMFTQFYTFCKEEILYEDLPDRVKENKLGSLTIEELEKKHILYVYKLMNNHVTNTWKALGISKKTLTDRLKIYGVK